MFLTAGIIVHLLYSRRMNGGKHAPVPRLQGRLPAFVLREMAHKIIKNPPQEFN